MDCFNGIYLWKMVVWCVVLMGFTYEKFAFKFFFKKLGFTYGKLRFFFNGIYLWKKCDLMVLFNGIYLWNMVI